MTTHLDDTQGLDEILVEVQSFIDDNTLQEIARSQAKQAILHWVATEIVGDDEEQVILTSEDGYKAMQRTVGKNQLRTEQRAKLALYGYKQNTKEVME